MQLGDRRRIPLHRVPYPASGELTVWLLSRWARFIPAAHRTYGRPLTELPLALAIALVVEDLLAPARMWGDSKAEANLWTHLAKATPAITPPSALGTVPSWWYEPLPSDTIKVET